MKKKITFILSGAVTIIVCGAAFLILSGMRGNEGDKDKRLVEMYMSPRPANIEVVKYNNSIGKRKYPGSVNASREVVLSFRVSGPLIDVNVNPGDFVKKDQVLMRIDPRDYEDKLRTLQARLSGGKSKLINASNNYFRAKKLISEAVLSTAEYDEAFSAYSSAQALVKDYEAQIQVASHQLQDTDLKAPFSGVITKQDVENSEVVSAGQPVIEMHYTGELEIEVNIPESEMLIHKLNTNEYGTVTFPTLKGKEFTVRLKEWNTRAAEDTRTYNVTFSLLSPEGFQILPGMTAEVNWEPVRLDNAAYISIPFGAVFSSTNENESAVWIYKESDSSLELRIIVTGPIVESDRIVVINGLSPGEQIVTAGTRFMFEGMKIKPVKTAKVTR